LPEHQILVISEADISMAMVQDVERFDLGHHFFSL
jgi:hypothetical protein